MVNITVCLPTILNRCIKCISNALFGFRLLWSPLDIHNKVHIYKRNNATETFFNLDSNLGDISIIQYFKGFRWRKFSFNVSKKVFINIWNDINKPFINGTNFSSSFTFLRRKFLCWLFFIWIKASVTFIIRNSFKK